MKIAVYLFVYITLSTLFYSVDSMFFYYYNTKCEKMKKTHPMISGVSGVMSHFTPTVIFFPLKVENIKVMSTPQFTRNQTGREIRDPSFPET